MQLRTTAALDSFPTTCAVPFKTVPELHQHETKATISESSQHENIMKLFVTSRFYLIYYCFSSILVTSILLYKCAEAKSKECTKLDPSNVNCKFDKNCDYGKPTTVECQVDEGSDCEVR